MHNNCTISPYSLVHLLAYLRIHVMPSSVRRVSLQQPALAKPLTKEVARFARAESTGGALAGPLRLLLAVIL